MGKPDLRVLKGTKDEPRVSFDDRLDPPGRSALSVLAVLGLWCAIAGGLVVVNEVLKLFEK
jgi:hypothetical protein